MKIAVIGASTPETLSTTAYFQNEKGEFIYGFCQEEGELGTAVQRSVDLAKAEGADIVILLAHLGEYG